VSRARWHRRGLTVSAGDGAAEAKLGVGGDFIPGGGVSGGRHSYEEGKGRGGAA
jgi:hypothetical protein